MSDWRWVNVVSVMTPSGSVYPEQVGQWINFDSVDIVRPFDVPRSGANTLLIGMDPINRMLVAEKIDPTQPELGEQHQQQPTGEE